MSDNYNTSGGNRLNIWLPLLFALTLVVGMSIGLKLKNGTPVNDLSFGKENRVEELLEYIDAKYVDEVDTDDLMDKAIKSILEELDPHSNYISPEYLQDVNDELEGNFEGIGIQFVMMEDTIFVVSAVPGGPSHEVGIKSGDRIIYIEDSLVAGRKLETKDVIQKLKGEKGSDVTVKIKRNGNEELLPFTITRDRIPIYSVDAAYMLNDKTGYIKINRFSATTYQEFMKAVEDMHENQGMKDLVIDLRQNPGGYLNAATKILDQIFPDRKLLVYTKGKNYNKNEYRSTGRSFYDIEKVSVLIDEGSASASEIMAGAIQDWDRGVIVGRRSFGKGLVQEQYGLSNGGALRLTVARYYTPSDRLIQKPYDDADAYDAETNGRYLSGELSSKDSVDIDTSTIYYTEGGRKVYAGGGIMPDIFVPIDTLVNNRYFIRTLPYIANFVYKYLDGKRVDFEKYGTIDDFIKDFKVSDGLVSKFTKYAEQQGVEMDNAAFQQAKEELRLRIKAHIGRQFFLDEGYYKILNTQDVVIDKALDAMQKPIIAKEE